MAHPHAPLTVAVDERDRRQEPGLDATLGALRVEMPRIDFVNDLHVPREQSLERRHRPGLERLRQQRVVGVVEYGGGDRPGEVPWHAVQVDQEPHQLRHSNGRVRVVQLNGGMIRKRRELSLQLLVAADEILQRRRGKEVFLTQPQIKACRRVVARIEDARNRLEPHPIGQRADMVAPVEVVERKRIGGPRRPQPQRVYVSSAPAGDRGVERDRGHGLLRTPDVAGRPVPVPNLLHLAAEVHRIGDTRPLELPRIAKRQPFLGQLVLPPVLHDLPEDAVVVPYAVPDGRNFQRCHAFHEAGGETAETPVAERRIGFELAQPVEIDPEQIEGLPHRRRESEIRHRVGQQSADQEFERKIVDPLAAFAIRRARRVQPMVDDAVAHRQGSGHEPIVVERVETVLAHHVRELGENCHAHLFRRQGDSHRRQRCVASVRIVSVGCHAGAVGARRASCRASADPIA